MIRNLILLVIFGWIPADISGQDSSPAIDFETQIRPVLKARCVECHGAEDQNGGLRLDARHFAIRGGDSGEVILPGDASKSILWRRLVSDKDDQMPPDDRLDQKQIALIQKWIEEGARWPETAADRAAQVDKRKDHWAFQPIKKITPPTQPGFEHPIDRFIAEVMASKQLEHSAPADRRTLIRRLSLDLTGLPPTPAEIKAFVEDSSSDAYAKIVKKLLDSPRYGERWAQHWLDVVRYADTHGFEVNTPRENSWPYRDYVIRAFNEDKPYDQFVREQIAGDQFGEDAATGFLVASAVLLPGQIGADDESKRLARQDELDEMVVGTGATFLGLTIGCARCHDHKFDPITAQDYYSMQAFFSGVDFGERQINDDAQKRNARLAQRLVPEIRQFQSELAQFNPQVFPGKSIWIDESDSEQTRYLYKENGRGTNPAGTRRGYRSDPGAVDRLPNISGGQYTWWDNQADKDVMYYLPRSKGTFDLWLSWGAHGSGVHTRDARYILDRDGKLETRDDQEEIAVIDQYYPAQVTQGNTEKNPLWSGLYFAGQVSLTRDSVILLRGGQTGTGITADTIVLQSSVERTEATAQNPKRLPSLREPVKFTLNTERFAPIEARFVRFTSLATDNNNFREPCLDELEIFELSPAGRNVALRSTGSVATSSGNYGNGTGIHQLAHINEGKYGNSHSWISNRQGKGWVQIELDKTYSIDRVHWGRDRLGQFKDRLPVQYKIEVSLDQEKWTTVASHLDRAPFGSPNVQYLTAGHFDAEAKQRITTLQEKLKRLQSEKARLEKPKLVYAGKFRQPDASFVLRRGNPELPGKATWPRVPEFFESNLKLSNKTPEKQRRLALAKWIASEKNPLTARVIVNRIWTYHFGQGLVATPSDFGVNATEPIHAELLDWLASQFIQKNWSIKKLHELIVTSATYRQQSVVRPETVKVDANNQYYWRYETRRLEGEAIRDSMLAVTGELNLKMGGRGFDFFKTRGGLSGFPEITQFKKEQFRRMIYAHKIRMERVPVFGAFDCPDAGQAMPLRSRSTTAIQALNLLNSPFVADRALVFAERVKRETESKNSADWVTRSFELALGRSPNSRERVASIRVVDKHGLESLCRVLFNSNEFLFIP